MAIDESCRLAQGSRFDDLPPKTGTAVMVTLLAWHSRPVSAAPGEAEAAILAAVGE